MLMVDSWKAKQNFCVFEAYFCGITISLFPLMFVESAILVSAERRFFLSTEIGVSLRNSSMACGLNLCVIEGLPSALATGFHHVVASSASVWICSEPKELTRGLASVMLSLASDWPFSYFYKQWFVH